MKRKLIFTFLSLLCCFSIQGKMLTQDSLLQELQQTKNHQSRFSLYRNLSDLTQGTPSEIDYLYCARQEASLLSDLGKEMSILCDIFLFYADGNKIDSAAAYREVIKTWPNIKGKTGCLTYINLSYFKLLHALNKSDEALRIEKKKITSRSKKSIYERLESAFILGSALSKEEDPTLSFSYLEQALQLSKNLPLEEWYPVQRLVKKSIAYNYLLDGQYPKAIKLIKELFQMNDLFYEKHLRSSRPFYNRNSLFLSDVTTIVIALRMVNRDLLPSYIAIVTPMIKKATNPRDKYNGFLVLNNYYLDQNHHKEALATNDSLIHYAKIIFPENLPGLYHISSLILEAMGNYEEALSTLRTSYALEDSLSKSQTQQQLNELQVQYDLEKLNNDKSQLEVKNKQIILTGLISLLVIVMGVCLYLYRGLKKERMMKARISILQQRAEESEKMKTSFVNSICHEIRTPLNSIVGFSDLLLDPSIEEEVRQLFPNEIRKNTLLLTSLIDCMLEVSKLDVSDEILPREPVHINQICDHEFDKIRSLGNPNLKYILDLPKEEVIINTHRVYLSLVLEQLLQNASKFTKEGSVSLQMCLNHHSKELTLSVSDTGCGIPAQKHEEVFKRFIKLDSFVAGGGLGLYLSRLIIRRLEGTIKIDPLYTKGTSFIIKLPI